MDLAPIARQSLPDAVFERLVGQIMAGALPPGDALPSERRLADALGVSRPAVREALQRLAQAGLVEIRQGEATTVRDWSRHGGIDLLPRLLLGPNGPDVAVLRSIVEARLLIGPQIAALAAERATPGHGRRLRRHASELRAAKGAVAAQRVALAFWDTAVDAAHSVVLRLLFNGLRQTYEPALAVLAQVMRPEVESTALYHALADAIATHRPDDARDHAHALLLRGTQALDDLADRLEEDR